MKAAGNARTIASARALARTPPLGRRGQFQLALLTAVDSLRRRRPDLVSGGFVQDYLALRWLEWRGVATCPNATDRTFANKCAPGAIDR